MDSEIDLWRECASLEEACELTARWLEGGMAFSPFNADTSPSTESTPLVGVLAAMNRCGFLTDQSQPGEALKDGQGQRAFVSGRCSEDTAAMVSGILLGTPLVVVTMPPGRGSSAQVCVTIDGGQESTWVGISMDAEDSLGHFLSLTNEAVATALTTSWEMHIFDPEWGNNDRLWKYVLLALQAAAEADALPGQ